MRKEAGSARIGVFDHTGASLGGGTLVAAHLAALLSRFYSVDLIRDWSNVSVQDLSSSFSLDLANVHSRSCDSMWESFGVPGQYSLRRQLQRSHELTSPYDLFICAGHWVPPFCYAPHGLIYCHFPIDLDGTQELANDARWAQRNGLDRWLRTEAYHLAWQARLNGYEVILANSDFTAGWIRRRWGVRSEVVYPPVELEAQRAEKRNRIASIGRFFGIEPRCKGHLAQVAALRQFLSRVPDPWELWMIGSCYCEKDRAYLSAVQEAARDLPIRFLVNVDRDAVLQALASAKVFWHTAGLFDKKAENPVFAEHFGMATVEAMRSRCVPIVVNSGGQREIVENGINGYLCEGVDDLEAHTALLAENDHLRAAMAIAAEQRSLEFSGPAFDRHILETVARILSRRPTRWRMQDALGIFARAADLSPSASR